MVSPSKPSIREDDHPDLQKEEIEEEEREDGEENEVAFEPFEPGNVWTQALSTQIHRTAWRHQVYLESEQTQADFRHRDTSGATISNILNVSNGVSNDDEVQEVTDPDANQQQMPWWSKGKTAPLLNDFDNERRSFYLAHAGIHSNEPRGHSHQGRIAAQMSPEKRALTLAGNANSSGASESMSSITITPKKKTWDATWGKDGERNGNASNKKRATPTSVRRQSTPSRARGGHTPRRGTIAQRGGASRS